MTPAIAPTPPDDLPRFTEMAEDLKDWLSHCHTFAGIDTRALWTQPAETARSFEAALVCMTEAGDVEPDWDAADDYPIERVQPWCAMNRPGVIVDPLAYEMASAWFATYGTGFDRPERDIHGDRLPPRPPTGPSRADEVIESWHPRLVSDMTPAEIAEWRADQAEIRQRDAVENSRFRPLSAAEMRQRPQAREIIRGVLPAVGIAAIFGPSMSAKSFLALDMIVAVSTRPDWFGHKIPTRLPCVYVGLEGEGGLAKRAQALNCEGIHFVTPGAFDLRSTDDRRELIAVLKAAGLTGGIVIVDTLAQGCPGMDENAGRDMGEAVQGLKALQTELGGLVVAVHHTGKDQTKGLRGHSSLLAALDAAIEVRREGDRREWTIAKAKDDADGASHAFSLDVVQVGQDADGEPITSCTVQPETQTTKPVRRTLPPKSGNQKIVWEALTEILRFAPAPDTPPEGLPTGRACVLLEAAVEVIRTRLVCDSKRHTERTQSAITGLINRGLLVHQNGWIWHA